MRQQIQKERLVLTVFNESDSERRSNELVRRHLGYRNQFRFPEISLESVRWFVDSGLANAGLGIKRKRGLGIKHRIRTKHSNYVLKN